jgi:hypothetical protein
VGEFDGWERELWWSDNEIAGGGGGIGERGRRRKKERKERRKKWSGETVMPRRASVRVAPYGPPWHGAGCHVRTLRCHYSSRPTEHKGRK